MNQTRNTIIAHNCSLIPQIVHPALMGRTNSQMEW